MSGGAPLTCDEVLALLSMTGGVPEKHTAWLAGKRGRELRALGESARAKLTAMVDREEA